MLKYRKVETPESPPTPSLLIKTEMSQPIKKSIIKLGGDGGLIINKIPAVIKPLTSMKRATNEPTVKSAKYSIQTIASAGTPLTSFQWQQTIGGPGGTTITATSASKKLQQQQSQIGAAISSLPPNTIIKATSGSGGSGSSAISSYMLPTNGGTTIAPLNVIGSSTTTASPVQVRRPTIYIKREAAPKRTIRSVTVELIENNPHVHLGVSAQRLSILKNTVCTTANVSIQDCYLTLKKLRQNEEFSLLAEYFELSEPEVREIFARSVVKLARYLRFLIRWPDSKKYYDRHKDLPFAYRSNLSHVQSLIECVETDFKQPLQHTDCSNYKFILSITPNGIISYISDAYVGHYDDLTIFSASNFQSVIPKYLSLVADPGKGIRRKRKPKTSSPQQNNGATADSADSTTDSAEESAEMAPSDDTNDDSSSGQTLSRHAATRIAAEVASHQTLNVVNSELTSRKVKDFTIPTMRVREPVCRQQIRQMIGCLREFKILQPCAIQDPLLYQYLNEILVVAAALTNLQR